MPRLALVLLFVSITIHSLNAQTSLKEKGFAATLTVSAVPIGQPGVALQPGIEYRFNEKWTVLCEFAFRISNKNSRDSTELDKQYLKFKSELRYHIPANKRRWSHDYIGFQVSWASRRFTNRNGFYYDDLPLDSVYYYSSASIKSPVTTASIQFGSILTEGRFAVDIFAGIGARMTNTTISEIVNRTKGIRARGADGIHFTTSYSYNGNKILFHLNGGIRFMWHFYDFKHPRKSKR